MRPPSWSYLPFGGGPRVCHGKNLALIKVAYTIVRGFPRYREQGSSPRVRGDFQAYYRERRCWVAGAANNEVDFTGYGSMPKVSARVQTIEQSTRRAAFAYPQHVSQRSRPRK